MNKEDIKTKDSSDTVTKRPQQNCTLASKWAAKVNDSPVFFPRESITVEVLKEQAGIPLDHILIRDHDTAVDVELKNGRSLNLAEGNVFYTRENCSYTPKEGYLGKAKLAWFIDDCMVVSTVSEQSESTLKGLFDLDKRIQLLRDNRSPNDTPFNDEDVIRFIDGPVLITQFDLMKHCECNEPSPTVRTYRIKVQETKYTVNSPQLTGSEILKLSGHDPKSYMLNQRINRRFEPVGLDDVVDFTQCGIERFTTLPNEQTEGEESCIRQFDLPEEDQELLNNSGMKWETMSDANSRWLIIHDITLPDIYEQNKTSMAILIPSGYPTAALDMAYFYPFVSRVDSKLIPQTQASVLIEGNRWQRWSRHYTAANPWKASEYNVFTHFLIALSWLEREVTRIKNVA